MPDNEELPQPPGEPQVSASDEEESENDVEPHGGTAALQGEGSKKRRKKAGTQLQAPPKLCFSVLLALPSLVLPCYRRRKRRALVRLWRARQATMHRQTRPTKGRTTAGMCTVSAWPCKSSML